MKMGPKQKFFLKIKQFLRALVYRNVSIFRIVLTTSILTCFSAANTYSQEVAVKSTRSSDVQKGAEQPKQEFKRIRELSGEVIIDGSIRVLEPIYGKTFDLVEVSTPVTPAANHARIFLRADGTKQSLVILYDDGTTDVIATNQ